LWPFKSKRHVLTDADRDLSLERRRLAMNRDLLDLELYKARHDLEMAQIQNDLQQLRSEGGDGEDSMLNQALTLLMSRAFGDQTPAGSIPQTPPQVLPTAGVSFSDEQLRDTWQQLPKIARKVAMSWSDEQLSQFIQGKMPGVDQDTINRAIAVVRSS